MSVKSPKPNPAYNKLQQENAVIARQQYDDFKERFQPFQDELNAKAMNYDGVEDEARAGMKTAHTQFANQNREDEINRGRFGVKMDAGQRAFLEKQRGLDRSKGMTTAYNKGIETASGRRDALREQMLGINRGQANEALGEFASAAQMEGQAGQADLARRTNKHNQNVQVASSLAGMAMAAMIMSSSKDKKEGIKKADKKKATDEVMGMDLKEYRYKPGQGPEGKRTGVIAEEAPDSITTPDKKAVNLGDWTAKNTAAIQETMKKVNEATKKVDRLAKRLSKGAKS